MNFILAAFFENEKTARRDCSELYFHGDPYGNRTHVTAVKGRCLNRLTNGPGSGNLIRTDDIPGMNRLLYQLSYAAMWSMQFRHRRNSFCIISDTPRFVKTFFALFEKFSRGLRRRCRPRDWGVSINQTRPDVPQPPPAVFCKIVLRTGGRRLTKPRKWGIVKTQRGYQ